mgnify:FL=1
MDKEMYKDIRGIEKFFEHFPDKPWHYFHEIIEFRWYREFDYEEWYNRFYINLVMSDREGKDIVSFLFKDVSGSCHMDFCGWMAGFDIVNLKYIDVNHETRYEIMDFEDSDLHFFCSDIEIKVLSVNWKDQAECSKE